MKKSLIKKCTTLLFAACVITGSSKAQAKPKPVLWDGMIIAGYVDDGAYVNFVGPSIKVIKKPFAVCLGMLPSLKIKEDIVATGAKKNSIVTPMLGLGLTCAYRHVALQIPLYYSAKTAAKDGKWKIGIGLGCRF